MDHDHDDAATFWRIFWAGGLPFHRRLSIAARNVVRRFTMAPHDCCGHPGEPGC